jgi:hypothetical protein
MQLLQGRLMQALAEVRQLQLSASEREQNAQALKLQLDAALANDADREAQMASALSAAAALQEERVALQKAREDALLQSARASVAAEDAKLIQSKPRDEAQFPHGTVQLAELQQCAASRVFFPSLVLHNPGRALASVKSGMTLSKYMRGGNSPYPPHDRQCRLVPLLMFGNRAVAVRSVSRGLPAAVTASLGTRGSSASSCSITIVGRDVSANGIFGFGVREAATDRVLVFTASEEMQAKAWLVALRALTGCVAADEMSVGA